MLGNTNVYVNIMKKIATLGVAIFFHNIDVYVRIYRHNIYWFLLIILL